jgi:hypothetical protein
LGLEPVETEEVPQLGAVDEAVLLSLLSEWTFFKTI